MSDLRRAAERTLRWLDSETPTTVDAAYAEERAIAEALRAALAQEQAEKQKLLEAVRVRIMSTAYDCADDGEFEAYNSVKVLCTELLEMLK